MKRSRFSGNRSLGYCKKPKVMPESETLFAESYQPARERAGKRADDKPDDDSAMVMVWMV